MDEVYARIEEERRSGRGLSVAGASVEVLEEVMESMLVEVALEVYAGASRGEICLTCAPYCERELVARVGLDVFGRDTGLLQSASSSAAKKGEESEEDEEDEYEYEYDEVEVDDGWEEYVPCGDEWELGVETEEYVALGGDKGGVVKKKKTLDGSATGGEGGKVRVKVVVVMKDGVRMKKRTRVDGEGKVVEGGTERVRKKVRVAGGGRKKGKRKRLLFGSVRVDDGQPALPSSKLPLPTSTQYVTCELCSRSVGVSRFAAHLASCLGMGRTARSAPRRAATAEKTTLNYGGSSSVGSLSGPNGGGGTRLGGPGSGFGSGVESLSLRDVLAPLDAFDPMGTPTEDDMNKVIHDPDMDWKQLETYISQTSKAAADADAKVQAEEAQAQALQAARAAAAAAARRREAKAAADAAEAEAEAAARAAKKAAERARAAAVVGVPGGGSYYGDVYATGTGTTTTTTSSTGGAVDMGGKREISGYALEGGSEEGLRQEGKMKVFRMRYNTRLLEVATMSEVNLEDVAPGGAFTVTDVSDISGRTKLCQLSPECMKALLSRICGVVNMGTKKMCSNSLKCPQHDSFARKLLRFKLVGRNELELIHLLLDEGWLRVSPPARRRGRPKKVVS